MKYVVPWGGGGDYGPYMRYLESVKHVMPIELFAFASNKENYDLNSPNSLHDVWLEEWNVAEVRQSAERLDRLIQINSRFLGPRHDRYICLVYKSVQHYAMHNPEEFGMPPRSGHGDLLIHELTIVREGLFEHELRFSRGTVFEVQFREFEHRIEMISTT
jgi:hypothetical protein